MTLLELIALRTRQALDASSAFDEHGEITCRDALDAALDLPMLCTLVMNVQKAEYIYQNRRMAQKIGEEHTFFGDDDQHRMTHHFDPSTVMHIFDMFRHFGEGGTSTMRTVMTLCEQNEDSIFCDAIASPLAFDHEGICTYAAYYICPMAERSLLGIIDLLGDEDLTARQWQVADLLIRGIPYKSIAEQLTISVKTLEKHLGEIYTKTGAQNQMSLMSRLNSLDHLF